MEEKTLRISLSDPNMTVLHRAGLAGLWMTLDAFEKKSISLDSGRWEKDDKSVTLFWTDEKFFEKLFKKSFQIDENGLFYFPALGDPMQHPQHAAILQEAVLGTLLQHGRTRKADKSDKPQGNLSFQVDDSKIEILIKYHKVEKYAHQNPDFNPKKPNKLVGWLYPGGVSRHVGYGNKTNLENPPGLALALRYLIIGAIYFEIQRLGGGVKPQYAMVIPEIYNLEQYAQARSSFTTYGIQRLKVAGSVEAGLRVLTELESRNLIEDLGAAMCRVFSFGIVPWSSKQKTRVEIFEVRVGRREDLRLFKLAQHVFEVRLIKPKDKEPFWDVPQIPELIAENLVAGRPWWRGFADFVEEKKRREHVFRYEKGGLAKMVEDKEAFPSGPERIFVEACHEAWRRRMGQLGERAKKEGISFKDLVAREFERVRVTFSRCKNASSIRAAITDFWSRGGGSLPALQEGWKDVLKLLDERNWQKARDLALLALASYRPTNKEEEEALAETSEEEEGK